MGCISAKWVSSHNQRSYAPNDGCLSPCCVIYPCSLHQDAVTFQYLPFFQPHNVALRCFFKERRCHVGAFQCSCGKACSCSEDLRRHSRSTGHRIHRRFQLWPAVEQLSWSRFGAENGEKLPVERVNGMEFSHGPWSFRTKADVNIIPHKLHTISDNGDFTSPCRIPESSS